MAREYAKAWFTLFTDDDFATMPHADKWLYMALLAQPALNYAGLQPINTRRLRKALRDEHGTPSEEAIEAALGRLERRRYVYSDLDTGEVLVRSFMRVDEVYRMPNTLKSGLRALSHIESPKLAAVMLAELDRLPLPNVKNRAEIDALVVAARTHLKALSDGIAYPFPEPITEGIGEAISDGMPEPIAKPGQIEGFPEPITEGIGEGSVVVEVEVVTPPTRNGYGGGSRTHTREAEPGIEPSPRSDRPEAPSDANPSEPPSRCAKHRDVITHPDPENCGPCANFRKAHERWTTRQTRAAAERRSTEARQRAETRAAAIRSCALCDDTGYRHGRVCDHDPAADDRARRGIELVRAALTKPDTAATHTASNSPQDTP